MMRSSRRGSNLSPTKTENAELFFPVVAPLDWNSTGSPDNLTLPNQYPMMGILFKVMGTLTLSAAGTVGNLFQLFDRVQINLVNEDRINATLSDLVRMVSYQNLIAPSKATGEVSHATGEALAAGNVPIYAQVFVPWDNSGYDSLFAAARHNPATLQVDSGAIAKAITGGGTVSFVGNLKVIPQYISGFPDGVPGGNEVAKKFKYMDRFYVSDELPLRQSTDLTIDMPQGRYYEQVLFVAYNQATGAPVTDLVKTIEYKRLNGAPYKFTPEEMQALNNFHKEWPYSEPGVYEPPFAINENPDTVLATFGNKGQQFKFELTRIPTANEKIRMLSSYLVGGINGKGRNRPLPGE